MPNYCDFDIKAKGKKAAVLKLYDWLNADYHYYSDVIDSASGYFTKLEKPEVYVTEDGKKRPVEHHIGYRIFECNLCEEDFDNLPKEEDIVIDGYGYCAWSCYSCMMDGPHTYYADNKGDGVSLSITLPDACRELGVEVEIFSSEPGMCFSEHFRIGKDGTVITSDCADLYEVWIDDAESFEEYEEKCSESGDRPLVTKEQFDGAKKEGMSYITKTPHLNEYGEWKYEIA